MNIVVFDTETTNLNKPFCYNIGYVIVNVETDTILLKRDYVVEQVWHNPMLFTTAYYNDKRTLYVNRMRARQVIMDKYGYITQQMIRDFKNYEIEYTFAYNSPFDTNVFEYNCEWFKTNNPFDNVKIHDIRGFVHRFIAFTKEYQDFCDQHQYYTESGNYSTTAETIYRYITNNTDFVEEHTALADSEIEWAILKYCLTKGAEITTAYKTYSSIKSNKTKSLEIVHNGTSTIYEYQDRKDYKGESGTRANKIVLKKN